MSERFSPHLWVSPTKEGAVVVRLVDCPVLDELTSPAVGEELLRLADGREGAAFRLDMGAVDFLTSTMLGTLVSLHKKLRAGGGSLSLYDVSSDVFEVFETARLDQLFEVRPKG
ncbi:MAG TPA: STAS domain-containing protein [Gemmataceae bacterium]|jgi:anti-anti-sigma factor|nr:STAS domain-containing protein [Gemmataceae bacterium]